MLKNGNVQDFGKKCENILKNDNVQDFRKKLKKFEILKKSIFDFWSFQIKFSCAPAHYKYALRSGPKKKGPDLRVFLMLSARILLFDFI